MKKQICRVKSRSTTRHLPVVALTGPTSLFRRVPCQLFGLLVCLLLGAGGEAQAQPAPPVGGGLWPMKDTPFLEAIAVRGEAPTELDAPAALAAPYYCDTETLRPTATIHCLRFSQRQHGVAVGDHGLTLHTGDGGKTWQPTISGVECALSDIFWIDDQRVLAVGGGTDPITKITRCVVIRSGDGGLSWSRAATEDLPRFWTIESEAEYFDRNDDSHPRRARSIVALGDVDPVTGNHVYLSQDGGKTWQGIEPNPRKPTRPSDRFAHLTVARCQRWRDIIGEPCVVRMSCKLDKQTYVCAGDHGCIFRSEDGGRTWGQVYDGGRCGILVIAQDLESVPWSLVGRQTLEQRLRCNVLIGTTGEPIAPAVRQAAMNLGVSSIERFDPIGDLNEGSLSDLLSIYDAPIIAVDTKLDENARRRIRVTAAQGETDKVVEFSTDGAGETLLHRNALLSDSGTLASDFDVDSLLWIDTCSQLHEQARLGQGVYINTVYSSGSQHTRSDDLSAGMSMTDQCRLPQRRTTASRRRQQVVQGRLRQHAMASELINGSRSQPKTFASSMTALLDQTSRLDRYRLAWTLAAKMRSHPQLTDLWMAINDRYPEMSSAQLAGLYAKTRTTSVEWSRWKSKGTVSRLPSPQISKLDSDERELLPGRSGHASIVSPFQDVQSSTVTPPSKVMQTSALLPLDETTEQSHTNQRLDLVWQMHPVKRITEDAITRFINEQASDEDTPRPQTSPLQAAALRQIAGQTTAWSPLLQNRSEQVTLAVRTDQPPRLDGNINEPMWEPTWAGAAQTRHELPISLAAAYDDEFLFIAIKVAQSSFRPGERVGDLRYRDADLESVDRFKLSLDCDRDLLTSMNLCFSHDGRTRDDLDGVTAWNPTWYLATDQQGDDVVCEIAIELQSLCGPIRSGDAWFIELQTITAGHEDRLRWMPRPEGRVRIDFQ
ncbi:hypothetical protein [Roseiconus lacunae]|uniref:hypothetical protein n=1 Tax=Roseiconus lacunae TaxID=2605694 RepID=UPI0011F1F634|nr:hypothetical protein [Roseiconus lacunae]